MLPCVKCCAYVRITHCGPGSFLQALLAQHPQSCFALLFCHKHVCVAYVQAYPSNKLVPPILQPPNFIDEHIMGQLLQTPWTTNCFLLCTLPEEQEAACQQVARLPCQQLATVLRVSPYHGQGLSCNSVNGRDSAG